MNIIKGINEADLVLCGEINLSRYNEHYDYSKCFRYLHILSSEVDCMIAANGKPDKIPERFTLCAEESGPDRILEMEGKTVFEINNINITVISTADTAKVALEKKDTDFLIVYTYSEELAEEAAEKGADYVLVIGSNKIGKYIRYNTGDKREVPLVESAGVFWTDSFDGERYISTALLKLRLIKDSQNRIILKDNYIPALLLKSLERMQSTILPIQRHYAQKKTKYNPDALTEINEQIGSAISLNTDRRIKIKSYYNPQLSIPEIYDVLGIRKPSKVRKLPVDEKVYHITMRNEDLHKGCVAFYSKIGKVNYREAKSAGAAMYIDHGIHSRFGMPSMHLPSKISNKEAFIELMKHIRNQYNPKVIAVTGNVGKTTTKDLIGSILSYDYKTLYVDKNHNTYRGAGMTIQKLDDSYEMYVQEIHEGSIDSVNLISQMIRPDVALITSIAEAHLLEMGSLENIKSEIMKITSGMSKEGVLFLNNDNEHLVDMHPENIRVIRYSSYNKNCDYYAKDIVDYGDHISFKIVSEDGCFDAEYNGPGVHNVNNAVGAYAVARWAGQQPEVIIAAISKFRSHGIRQNLIEAKGCRVLVDCYSSTPISVISSVETMIKIPKGETGRRIVVLGDIPALGEASEERHVAAGKKLAGLDFDEIYCYGGDSRIIADICAKAGKKTAFFKMEDKSELSKYIEKNIRENDVLLFKGGSKYHLETCVKDVFKIDLTL